MAHIRFALLWFLLVLTALPLTAQSRRELERRRQELNAQIHRISKQLNRTRLTEKNALSVYQMRSEQINYHQKLIANLKKDLRLIDRQLQRKNDSLRMLNADLENLKTEYAEAVRKVYKFSGTEKRLYFILSARNFQQAYRRIRYLREYTDYIRRKADEIMRRQSDIRKVRQALQERKHEKQNALTRLADEQRALEREQARQKQLLAQIRQKKSHYIRQIRKKQRQARQLDRQIQRLIAAEIARRNKARGKRGKSEFVLTPQGRALAKSFAANKGRLPWPVRHGYVSRRFGRQQHPVFKNIPIVSSGIFITTPPHEQVSAIFDGEVMMIQVVPGGNAYVYVRHGNYISIYGNLENLSVRQGQKIRKGQTLGRVALDVTSNTYVLKFKIYKNTVKLNPSKWLAHH